MTGKRHDKPTPEQLLARIYRRQIEMEAKLDALIESHRLVMDHVPVLIAHCRRLVREKDTLMSERVRAMGARIDEANRYISEGA